ncbi:MAG: branched-chain amino acid ABC transporter permease [Boseongicola sp. SB0677_bin_26]|nr:branched-chain amino acid ABC transporter permease [Boseongicola sp. SB0677_bin_26]
MAYYLGLLQTIGIHTLLGLSAYVLLLTGQLSLAQVGFFAIGAYISGILTVIFEYHIVPGLFVGALAGGFFAFLVGFPALRIKGLMLVVATIAFSEIVRLFFFNLNWRVMVNGVEVGPDSTQGFREIRFYAANGWDALDVVLFIWLFVTVVMAMLWWLDRVRAGATLRAVGADELAAQSSGVNIVAVKVSAMTCGGVIAGLAGGLYAHSATYVDHLTFSVLLATFAVAYPILGGLSSVFGTLIAVIFIQGILIEGMRFLGDWRSMLFGLLIIVAMNFRPAGLLDGSVVARIRRILGRANGSDRGRHA